MHKKNLIIEIIEKSVVTNDRGLFTKNKQTAKWFKEKNGLKQMSNQVVKYLQENNLWPQIASKNM